MYRATEGEFLVVAGPGLQGGVQVTRSAECPLSEIGLHA